MVISNPILPGFHPDPSILRVGADFYIATSTFHWWPGVRIHHSRDLVHWRLLGHALTRRSQIDLRGHPASAGVWAPCLSHDGARFHLAYTDVRHHGGGFTDAHNNLVTAEDPSGPWSDPVPLNASGFDPSLFHDRDGRTWLLNMLWDHRAGDKSGGILLQEYDRRAQRLVGAARLVFRGTGLGGAEGPHLYVHDGRYHLMIAEGGTGFGHAVTMARAERIEGPYEADPRGPLLTSRDDPSLPLQKAGHASLVELPDGSLYLAHLCSRPLPGTSRCPLGRETALQRVDWSDDGWLRLHGGGHAPALRVPAPGLPAHPWPPEPRRHDFDGARLPRELDTLREPPDPSWLTLTERPGWLRLRGRESPVSRFAQSLVARRVTHLRYEATTCLECRPRTFQQLAGLVVLYDEDDFVLLRLSADDEGRLELGWWAQERGRPSSGGGVPVPEGPLWLRVRCDGPTLRFSWSPDGRAWTAAGPAHDASRLSDDVCKGFTGTFVGLACHDMSGARFPADFAFLELRPLVD